MYLKMNRSYRGIYIALAFISTAFAHAATPSPVAIHLGPAGYPEFTVAGQHFVPIGVNVLSLNQGPPYTSFDMYDTDRFSAPVLNRSFAALQALGYDFVRLWLTGYQVNDGFGLDYPGLSDAYVKNVLTSLQIARAHGLRVILTGSFRKGQWLPRNYVPTGLPPEVAVGGMNRLLLLRPMASATGRFYADLLRALRARDPTILSTIFYFDLYNELHFDLSQPPFNGTVTTYTFAGRNYDMANPASRQALMDAAGTAWVRTVSHSVHDVDPDLLVTASTFGVAAFGHRGFDGGKENPRHRQMDDPYPLRPQALIAGGAQLLDMHVYSSPAMSGQPAFHTKVLQLMALDGLNFSLTRQLPVVLGEFGTHDIALRHPAQSIPEMLETWRNLCSLHISGYALWSLVGDISVQKPAELELLDSFVPHDDCCIGPTFAHD